MAALIEDSILVVHGGLGDGKYSVKDIENIPRPLTTENISHVATNVLWSDPSDSDDIMAR